MICAGAVIASLLAGCVPPDPPSPDGVYLYVALGDSGVAGPAILPQLATPLSCTRSTRNYPHLVAARLGLTRFADMSCSGAKAANLTEEQRFGPDDVNPPQITPLSAATRVVTVGLGANDINLTEIVVTCLLAGVLQRPGGCEGEYQQNGRDVLFDRIDDVVAATRTMFTTIRDAAPNANIYTVGGAPMFPVDPAGCFPAFPIPPGDIPWIRRLQDELDRRLDVVLAEFDVTNIDTPGADQHDICQPPEVRWLEPLALSTDGAPYHPNAAAHRAQADALAPVVARDLGIRTAPTPT